ncbi:MAG: ArsR/SmtB family transcription factor [Terricaulis sp.]
MSLLPAERAEAASQLLKALASPHRLMIACHLSAGEETVGGLAGVLGLKEPAVSQHLAVMRRERLVAARREGQSVFYSLQSNAARDIITALARSFCALNATHEHRR